MEGYTPSSAALPQYTMKFQNHHYLKSLFALALILFPLLTFSQATVAVTVLSGTATTTCTDGIGNPDPRWRVQVDNGNWEVYPATTFCFNNPPMLQYNQQFNCPYNAPATVQVCFAAFEDDGNFCNINPSCYEEICQDFPVPVVAGVYPHQLALPANLSSGGSVDFIISVQGGYPGGFNDLPCSAVDLGIIQPGQTIGDNSLSNYNNLCSTNANEPQPLNDGAFYNDQGVWFQFTTSANPGSLIQAFATSDPEGLGDDINIELALYESSDGSCTGTFNLVTFRNRTGMWDEQLRMECLQPNTTYFLMVDGAWSAPLGSEGLFGLELQDAASTEGEDFICDAIDFGQIAEGGNVSATSQSNVCATDIGEADPSGFVGQRTVWYCFTPPSSGHVFIETISDLFPPAGIDPINLQIAVFTTHDGSCSGNWVEITSQFSNGAYDEVVQLECLDPMEKYWIMIDGAGNNTTGIFDIAISDAGPLPPHYTVNIDETLCFGESLTVGDSTYTESGIINELITAADGCDSLVTGSLIVLSAITTTIDTTVCSNASIQVGSSIYTLSGNYTDVLMANNGCDSTVFTSLTVLSPLSVSATMTQQASGYLTADGSASAQANGGSGNYVYTWSDGQIGTTANNLQGGLTYCVTVTDDIGCTAEDCVLIFFPSNILSSVISDTLDCIGDTDGELIISISNGAWPYNYQWENADGSLNGSGTVDTEGGSSAITNLPAGIYSFTISDGFGFSSAIGQVMNPEPIVTTIDTSICFGASLQVGNTTYSSSGTINEVLISHKGCDSTIVGNLVVLPPIETVLQERICEGEVLMVGSTPYTQNGPIYELLTAANGCDSLVSGRLTVIPPVVTNLDTAVCFGGQIIIGSSIYYQSGNYTDNFTAADGCDSIVNTQFTVYDQLVLTINVINEASGLNAADGLAEVLASGGSGLYTYQWSNGQTSSQATALVGGTQYCVTVTDDHDCSAEVCELILFPVNILSTITADTLDCYGDQDGTIRFNAFNGQAPYNYLWQNADNSLQGSGQISTEGGMAFINTLPAGNYMITIADQWGLGTFSVNIVEPEPLTTLTLAANAPSCFGSCDGSIELQIMGGTPPYFVADGTPLNGNLVTIDQLCAELPLSFGFMDANGCTIDVIENIDGPEEFIATATEIEPVRCFGESNGQGSVTTNGNPIAYLWDNGETTVTATQLDAGMHSITVTNSDDCEAITQVFINAPAEALSATVLIESFISCHDMEDGALSVSAVGGTNLSFLWSNGATESTIDNLAAGSYSVTVTDGNGCEAIGMVSLDAPDPLQATFDKADVNCLEGDHSGWISIPSVMGGVGPYLYSLDGGAFSANNTFGQLSAGLYEVIVEDASGCEVMEVIQIEDPDLLIVELGNERSVKLGESVLLTANTNNPNVSYSWSTDSLACNCPQIEVNPFHNTIYSVTVTDPISGCTSSDEVLVMVSKERDVFIPNAFSPNNDGINDLFMIYADQSVQEVKAFRIFDRWGELIFEAGGFQPNNRQFGWTGKTFGDEFAPLGVYVYMAEIEFKDGIVQIFKGDVTLVK